MKYALVFFLGLLPLAVLSAKRGWEVVHFEEDVPSEQAIAPPHATAGVGREAVAVLRQWQPAVTDLQNPEMFRRGVPPVALPGVADTEWNLAWRRCAQAWTIADSAVPILHRPADGDYLHLTSALQDMGLFLAEHDFNGLEGGSAVQSLWKQRIARFLLAAAVAARDSGRYRQCIALCDKYLAGHRDTVEAGQATGLKSGAAFCEAAGRVRADLAAIGEPTPQMPPAEGIDKLKQWRNRLSQFIDHQRKVLEANEAWVPATDRRAFAEMLQLFGFGGAGDFEWGFGDGRRSLNDGGFW